MNIEIYIYILYTSSKNELYWIQLKKIRKLYTITGDWLIEVKNGNYGIIHSNSSDSCRYDSYNMLMVEGLANGHMVQ